VALLPPSTNAGYRGSIAAAWFLALSAVMTIVPGLIHYFLPDGGSGVIARIDLTTRADTIIALRYRTLVPLVLLLLILMQSLSAFSAWFWKSSQGGHHPPEHYGSALFVFLGLAFLALSLRPRRA
jgi:hypothetical protein